MDPLLASLHEIRDMTGPSRVKDADEHNQRVDALLDFFSTVEKLGHQFVSPPGAAFRSPRASWGSLAGVGGIERRGERS